MFWHVGLLEGTSPIIVIPLPMAYCLICLDFCRFMKHVVSNLRGNSSSWMAGLKPSGYGQEGEKRALARDDLIQEHHGFDTDLMFKAMSHMD